MKKGLFIAAAIFVAGSMSSCKKDYTCTCTETITGAGSTSTPTTFSNVTKSQATTDCNNLQTAGQTGVSGYTFTCSL